MPPPSEHHRQPCGQHQAKAQPEQEDELALGDAQRFSGLQGTQDGVAAAGPDRDGMAVGRISHHAERAESTQIDVDAAADESFLVADALSALPADQLEVITLAHFDGLSQSEIAHRLDLPLGTVKSRTRLALDRLRTELDHPDEKQA